MAIWSPGPGGKVNEAAPVDSRTSDTRYENLEDIYVGIDSLMDTDMDRAKRAVDEEDDPLAEFEAWLVSGAVQIVDKL